MNLKMAVWNYPDNSFHPHEFANMVECPFCSIPLHRLFLDQRLSKSHNQNYDDLEGFVCPACGWWKVIRETGIWGPYSQSRHMSKFAHQKFCQAGSLKSLDKDDNPSLMEELRSPPYAHDSSLPLQLAEEIMARVNLNQVYKILVTSISIDGSILVILARGNKKNGIRIKCSRESITLEQLETVTGALVRAGSTRGIFVATSRLEEKGFPIELFDPKPLFDALGLEQIPLYGSEKDFLGIHNLNGMARIKASDGF